MKINSILFLLIFFISFKVSAQLEKHLIKNTEGSREIWVKKNNVDYQQIILSGQDSILYVNFKGKDNEDTLSLLHTIFLQEEKVGYDIPNYTPVIEYYKNDQLQSHLFNSGKDSSENYMLKLDTSFETKETGHVLFNEHNSITDYITFRIEKTNDYYDFPLNTWIQVSSNKLLSNSLDEKRKIYKVDNLKEFLSAIGSDRIIEFTEEQFVVEEDFFAIIPEEEREREYYSLEDSVMSDPYSYDVILVVKNVKNLTVKGGVKIKTKMFDKSYNNLRFQFVDSENISLENLSLAKDTFFNDSPLALLSFSKCKTVSIKNCKLEGYSTNLIKLNEVLGFSMDHSNVTKCTKTLLESRDSEHLYFNQCEFLNNIVDSENIFFFGHSNHVYFNSCTIKNNKALTGEHSSFCRVGYSSDYTHLSYNLIMNNDLKHFFFSDESSSTGVVLQKDHNKLMKNSFLEKEESDPKVTQPTLYYNCMYDLKNKLQSIEVSDAHKKYLYTLTYEYR